MVEPPLAGTCQLPFGRVLRVASIHASFLLTLYLCDAITHSWTIDTRTARYTESGSLGLYARDMDPQVASLPATLLDLLLNPIIQDNIVRYLTLSTLLKLAHASRRHRDFILNTPGVFKYTDLSHCKGAYTPLIAPIDAGGHSWRAERMDENLTEDEFYAGPLRYVLGRLNKLRVLSDVQVLVLDGLASVTHELVHEIVTDERFNVRLLSIRRCPNINQARLQQLLRHICRPSRPEGTPRLQGVYVFTNPANDPNQTGTAREVQASITAVDGATLGLRPSNKSRVQPDNADQWYYPSGRVFDLRRTPWEETLLACKGIIAFDAVLCTAMHDEMRNALHPASEEELTKTKPGIAPLATIALGPDGCTSCSAGPVHVPIWGRSPVHDFPLLSPPPFSGKLIDATRPPAGRERLIVSCSWCITNRHCDSCHRWWCARCYNPRQSTRSNSTPGQYSSGEAISTAVPGSDDQARQGTDSFKVFNGLCIENCLVGEMMAGAGSNGMWA